MDTVQTEYAVIGCALSDASCHAQVSALPQDAFTTPQTMAIHRALIHLFKNGIRADTVSVQNASGGTQGVQTAIQSAIGSGFSTLNYRAYEGSLLQERKRRIVRAASLKALSDCDSGASVQSISEQLMQSLQQDSGSQESISSSQALMRFVDSINSDKNKGRCYSGIQKFDRITGGFRGGKLVVIGARPGVGKTALALSIAMHAAHNTGPVLFVSLEMSEEQVMSRVMASVSGVDCERFESGNLTEQDYKKMGNWYEYVAGLKLRIATHANTPVRVRRQASAMKYGQGLSLIVVDYMQLMKAGGKSKSRYEQVSQISRQLKILASDLGVPVVALTQFNRDSERDSTMPTMAQAKDSGSIEQDANLFLILWPVPQPTEKTSDQDASRWTMCHDRQADFMKLIIAKNRQGRTGIVDCYFWKKHMRFRGFKEDNE